jgi:hypothetical protein
MNNNCVCLICLRPNDIWLEFLSKFKNYDIFVVVDDNSKNYESNYNNINIIQIQEEDCIKNNFRNITLVPPVKEVTGWDKSLYYFSAINNSYSNVWFFEDDVFFYNEDTLLNIDKDYNGDLLTRNYSTNKDGKKDYWHWAGIDIKFPPPYYSTMVCCIRTSKLFLSKVKEYTNQYDKLFFLEAFFPTICKYYNLKYENPSPFEKVIYRKDYKDDNINTKDIFHPIKDISKHEFYRNLIKEPKAT